MGLWVDMPDFKPNQITDQGKPTLSPGLRAPFWATHQQNLSANSPPIWGHKHYSEKKNPTWKLESRNTFNLDFKAIGFIDFIGDGDKDMLTECNGLRQL